MPTSNPAVSPTEMIRLRTLGGVAVLDAAGEPIRGATAQRRPLALMAILAACHPHGMTRDKLVGLLWPDADTERAGHSLTQALYAARRALAVDDLFLTDGPISLNPQRISSDIVDVERELAAGNVESAVAAYAGPFLDGFYVSGAGELERWVSGRRDELEQRLVEGLERLARQVADSQDLERAIRTRRQLAQIRPLDSANITALVEHLAVAGRRAEAVRQAHIHMELVGSQLGLPPDAALLAVVNRLREAPVERAAASSKVRRPELTKPVPNAVEAPGAATGSSQLAVRRETPARRRRLGAYTFIGAAVVSAAVGLATIHKFGGAAPAQPVTPRAGSASLIVAPFDVSAANERVAYLGNAVVQLLGPRLVLDSTRRAMDAGVTLTAWQRRGFERHASVPRDSAIRFASELGARLVVLGSVVGDRDRALLTASVVSIARNRILAQAAVQGPADSIASLTTQLAAKLLVAQAGDSERVAVLWAHSFPALRLYTAARLADRRGDPAASARFYEQAIELEPTFATAALRLAIAADRLGNADEEARALASAWAHRDMLGADERMLLLSFVGPRYPEPSLAAEQLHAWERIAQLDARNPSMWQQLAAHLYHEGARLGVPTAEQAGNALDHALELGEGYGPADELRDAMRGPSPAARIAADDRLEDTTLSAVRAVAMASLWRGTRPDEGARALDVLNSKAATTSERVDAILAQHSLALNHGRSADALAWTTRLHEVKPDSHAHLRLQVLDALYGDGDTTAAAMAVNRLSRTADSIFHDFPLARRRADADACVIGQWRLAHEDTTGVAAITHDLSSRRVWHESELGSVSWGVCGQLLSVALAVTARRPDALARVQHLDALMLTPAVAGNSSMYAHLLVSRLYERLGQQRLALAAVRKRDEMLGWPTYLAASLRQEWRLATAVGDVEGASIARQRYIACHGGDGP